MDFVRDWRKWRFSTGNRLAKFARTVEAKKSLPTEGDWEWGGCGDNVNFGFKKSREFMDAPYRKRSDIKTLVKLHNNDAGRLVSNSHYSLRCYLHIRLYNYNTILRKHVLFLV